MGPATNSLDPIKVVTTRGAGITAAAGTRLVTRTDLFVKTARQSLLPTPYSPSFLSLRKAFSLKRKNTPNSSITHAPVDAVMRHSVFAHCGSFALAASRRTWNQAIGGYWNYIQSARLLLVSESMSGLPLSRPVPDLQTDEHADTPPIGRWCYSS